MSAVPHSPSIASTPSKIVGFADATSKATRSPSNKALAAFLLAAFVAALLVVADSVVDTYAAGHLLVGWISLWAVGFVGMAMLRNTASRTAAKVIFFMSTVGHRRAQKNADAYLRALAKHDPRIRAEVQAAIERANTALQIVDHVRVQAWVERHPLGTFNAAYQFPSKRKGFQTTPLPGLPTHAQYMPG